MKKNIILAALFVAAALFAGCSATGSQINFNAVILELNGDSVLVEACVDDDIRRSSDKITFSSKDLDKIDAQAGDTVTVTYTGGIMESYPAQVRAVSWSILQKAEEEKPETTPLSTAHLSDSTVAEYSVEGVSMSIALPNGWSYETIAAEPHAERFGIKFWPDNEPSVELSLEYHVNGIGLCGTGVTFTEHEFANGLSATAATEVIQGDQWFMLIYDKPNTKFAVSCTVDLKLWKSHEGDIMSILDTVSISGGLK